MPLLVLVIAALIMVGILIKEHNHRLEIERLEKIEEEYRKLQISALNKLGFTNWGIVSELDENITVKSRQSLEKYTRITFFKEHCKKLQEAEDIIKRKNDVAIKLREFLENNEYKTHPQYQRLSLQINDMLKKADAYRVQVTYISSAGNNLGSKVISVRQHDIDELKSDPTLLMSKSEYNKYIREQQKEALSQKQQAYYANVNSIIDCANENQDYLVVKGSQEKLDNLIMQLFDRTVNSIKKIKTIDSEEWEMIGNFVNRTKGDIEKIIHTNQQILEYYASPDFAKVKEACEGLMSAQREFNEYITEKVQSVSQLFGTRVVRSETIHNDEYNYIRPYKKTISPFTMEVSAAVFASAENNPMEYIVKYFYPNKKMYKEQIQNLYRLVEELQTLRDAKQIIENYKAEYQQYLGDVPAFVTENDEAGFYSRLGFAIIDESVLSAEYKFSYTSGGGMAQRFFTVPMTEETIAELINMLESKLTASAFVKEQRALMTQKLREFIKTRDNFTCCNCGNSISAEPNLLLEIDHITPVSKGGLTEEDNLQTLCWKCNRAKSNKIIQ